MKKVIWIFKEYAHFGFIIPKEREIYGGDFFVAKKNFRDAKEWDKVVGHIIAKTKWKKPEAKIVQVGSWIEKKAVNRDGNKEENSNVIWIYSEHRWDFGFVDVPWEEKWVFVFKKDTNSAKDWDKVEAKVKMFNWRREAVITKILENESPLIKWVFKDKWKFGFVSVKIWKKMSDIFVAWAKKLDAKDWDKVEVQIIKESERRPEGVIRNILQY